MICINHVILLKLYITLHISESDLVWNTVVTSACLCPRLLNIPTTVYLWDGCVWTIWCAATLNLSHRASLLSTQSKCTDARQTNPSMNPIMKGDWWTNLKNGIFLKLVYVSVEKQTPDLFTSWLSRNTRGARKAESQWKQRTREGRRVKEEVDRKR